MKRALKILSVAWEMAGAWPSRFRAAPEVSPEAVRRIAVMAYMGVGDAILFLPALQAFKKHFPESRLTALTGPYSQAKEILKRAGAVDDIIEIPWQKLNPHEREGELSRLNRLRFDAVILPYTAPIRFFLPWIMNVPVRAGHIKNIRFPPGRPLIEKIKWQARFFLLEEELFRRYAANLPVILHPDSGEHESARYGRLAEALGCPVSMEWGKPPVASEETQAADQFLTARGVLGQDTLVALHPLASASQNWKEWPMENFVEITRWLIQNKGAKVALLGTQTERERLKPLLSFPSSSLIDAAGSLKLGETLALLKRCRLFIGVDSGPGHMAIWQGVPSVRIFGPSDPTSFKAWKEENKHREIFHDIFCRPCLALGSLKPGALNALNCGHRGCLTRTGLETVQKAIEGLL